jgi:hypothetical protein
VLFVADLGSDVPAVREVTLVPRDGWTDALALDDAGERVVLSARGLVALAEITSGRVIARTPMPATWPKAAAFRRDATLRIYGWKDATPDGSLEVVDWNPADGSLTDRAHVVGGPLRGLLQAGDLAVVRLGDTQFMIEGGDSATRSFPEGWACLLSDGNVAMTVPGELTLVSASGERLWSRPREDRAVLAMLEWQPGQLAIGVLDYVGAPGGVYTDFFELASGELTRREPGILPAFGVGYLGERPPKPGSFGARIFEEPTPPAFARQEGRLVRLLEDGTREPVVPGRE